MTRLRILIWRTVHKFIFLLCLMPLALISGSSTYKLLNLYFFSSQVTGVVNKYGVAIETVGSMGPGNYSTGSDTQLIPWIEFLVTTHNNLKITCKVDGQYSIFGRYVSDDADVLKLALDKLIASNQKIMQIYLVQAAINECAVSRKFSVVAYAFLCLFIISALATIIVIFTLINSWTKFSKNRYA